MRAFAWVHVVQFIASDGRQRSEQEDDEATIVRNVYLVMYLY